MATAPKTLRLRLDAAAREAISVPYSSGAWGTPRDPGGRRVAVPTLPAIGVPQREQVGKLGRLSWPQRGHLTIVLGLLVTLDGPRAPGATGRAGRATRRSAAEISPF